MLKLTFHETCPYGNICPYSAGCFGLRPNRHTEFTCNLISFDEGKPYFSKDETLKKNEYNTNSSKKILHG